MVWYGMVWCLVVLYSIVRDGMVWCDLACSGRAWYAIVPYGTGWYSIVWNGATLCGYGMVWYMYGMAWDGIV